MTEWPTMRIKEIAKKVAMGPFGSNIKVETFVSAGVPIISGQHLRNSRLDESGGYKFITEAHADRLANSNVFPGDIVFTHAGTIGQVALIPAAAAYDRYVISQRQFFLRVDRSKADPAFITRWFRSAVGRHRLLMHASQVGVPSISRPASNLKTIEIELPTLREQKAISTVLDVLDDKIELNRRMNETLEAMARVIFKDWFVDFGPTRAKMEGRTPYLDSELWDLFPDALDDDGKPVGWRRGKLDDLIVLQRGFDLPKPKRVEGEYAILAASGVNGTHNEAKVPGPGVTTGRSGVIGKVHYVYEDFWPLNTSLWVKEYRNSSPAHAYYLIWTLDFGSFNSGSAVPTLNRNHVHSLPMAIPSPKAIQGFDRVVGPLLQRKRVNDIENKTLKQTLDLLLPRLMSGEICLRDAEEVAEAVA